MPGREKTNVCLSQCDRVSGLAHFDELRDAEVEQLQRAIAGHQDVRGFQVAMDDEVLMRGVDCRADAAEQSEAILERTGDDGRNTGRCARHPRIP